MAAGDHAARHRKRRVGFARKLSDVVEMYESARMRVYRSAPMHRAPDCPDELHDPHSDTNPDKDLFALAEARDRALRLAEEVDEFGDSATRSCRGCCRGSDDRRATVIWTKAGGLMYDYTSPQGKREERLFIGMYNLSLIHI